MRLDAPFDVRAPVDTASVRGTARAVNAMLAPSFEDWDAAFVDQAFDHVGEAYAGRLPGLLACDTPYHDLRHALETALATARLVDGWELDFAGSERSLGAPLAMATVVLALMHDIGFLRREDERHLAGAALTAAHEARAAEYAQRYLAATRLHACAPLARLIDATRIGTRIESLGGGEKHLLAARMLATADLVSQLADRHYLEKCRDFLYLEFVEAGLARGADGRNPAAPYESPEDLLRRTPGFYRKHVLARLDGELGGVHRLFTRHFGGPDPYREAIARNMNYLERVLDRGDFGLLRRTPHSLSGEGGT